MVNVIILWLTVCVVTKKSTQYTKTILETVNNYWKRDKNCGNNISEMEITIFSRVILLAFLHQFAGLPEEDRKRVSCAFVLKGALVK